MPLTTRHADGRWMDSTDDEHWREVHRPGYKQLHCPECNTVMVARSGGDHRIRHFAHISDSAGCSISQPESAAHLHTKAQVARAVRQMEGWTAEIEHVGDGWRADVLAIGDRRVAFEVQFSGIHPREAEDRTDRHAASGVAATIWLDGKHTAALRGLERAQLVYDKIESGVFVLQVSRDGHGFSVRQPLRWFVREVCLDRVVYGGDVWALRTDRARLDEAARERQEAATRTVAATPGNLMERVWGIDLPAASDGDILALCEEFAERMWGALGGEALADWRRVGDSLHAEAARRLIVWGDSAGAQQ